MELQITLQCWVNAAAWKLCGTDYSVQPLENIPGFQLTKTMLPPHDIWLGVSFSLPFLSSLPVLHNLLDSLCCVLIPHVKRKKTLYSLFFFCLEFCERKAYRTLEGRERERNFHQQYAHYSIQVKVQMENIPIATCSQEVVRRRKKQLSGAMIYL